MEENQVPSTSSIITTTETKVEVKEVVSAEVVSEDVSSSNTEIDAKNSTTESESVSPVGSSDHASSEAKIESESRKSSSESSDSEEEEDEWRDKVWRGGFFRRKEEPEPNVAELWEKESKLTLEERRKRYHCRKFTRAEDIITWDQYAKDLQTQVSDSKIDISADTELNKKIALWHGDITTIETDGAIVNAANESCLGGGGVDGAIHSAAGHMLYLECRTLHGCNTGESKITCGYNLPAKYIIHTVGPVGRDARKLQSCYWSSLQLAVQNNIKTVIFCGISSGIFGYPLYEASTIGLKTVRDWLGKDDNRNKVDKIIFCTFLDKERFCYHKLTPLFFPLPQISDPSIVVPSLEENNNNSNV